MNIKIGDYQVTSDSYQFIVNKIGIVQESRLTNPENVGKETLKVVAYCGKFDEALRFIPNDVLKCNDDINVIVEKLNEIQEDIKALEAYPVIVIKEDDEMTVKKETYKALLESDSKLSALEGAGVDNWNNYDYAMELMSIGKDKEEIEENE